MLYPTLIKDKILTIKGWKCVIVLATYAAGGYAITLKDAEDGSPIGTLTKYLDGIPESCVALDVNNWGDELPWILLENNIIEDNLINVLKSGYCLYPVYKLHPDILKQVQ